MPSVPPYSSTTIARCWFSRRISRQGGEHARRPRQPLHLAGEVADGRGAAGGVVGQEQVAHVHEADDVVLVAAGDREARPAGVGDLLGRPAGGHRRVEEGDLGARGHDLAHLALAGAEDLVDQPALVAGQRLVRGDQVAQLLLADRLAARPSGRRRAAGPARSVDADSSQMTGRDSLAMAFSGAATISAKPSARCSASRLGVSSPTTSDR